MTCIGRLTDFLPWMIAKAGRGVAFGLLLLAWPGAIVVARAAPQTITIAPGNTEIGFRLYLFGFVPLDGHFTRFVGSLTVDPADPAHCSVTVRVETASLVMPNAEALKIALGDDFLDAVHFPALAYGGTCHGALGAPPRLDGVLAMHGRTGALAFTLHPSGGAFAVSADLHRAAWGMGAHPLLAGDMIRLRVTTRLLSPAEAAAH